MSPDHIRWQVQGEGQARGCGAQRQGTKVLEKVTGD